MSEERERLQINQPPRLDEHPYVSVDVLRVRFAPRLRRRGRGERRGRGRLRGDVRGTGSVRGVCVDVRIGVRGVRGRSRPRREAENEEEEPPITRT